MDIGSTQVRWPQDAWHTACTLACIQDGVQDSIRACHRMCSYPLNTKRSRRPMSTKLSQHESTRIAQGDGCRRRGTRSGARDSSSRAFAADKVVVGVIYVGPKDDYGYNQAQAQAAAAIKKLPGRDGDRRGEGARDRGRAEDHGLDDRAGRRRADLPHLLRLLRSAHDQDGGEVSEGALRALRRPVDRGASTRRTPAAISATSTSAST